MILKFSRFNSSFIRKKTRLSHFADPLWCELIFILLSSTRLDRAASVAKQQKRKRKRVTRDEQPNKIVGLRRCGLALESFQIAIQSDEDAGWERARRALRSAVQHRGCCTSSIRALTHLAMFPSSGHGISLYEITNLIFLFFYSIFIPRRYYFPIKIYAPRNFVGKQSRALLS